MSDLLNWNMPPTPSRYSFMHSLVIDPVQAFFLIEYLHRGLEVEGGVCDLGLAHPSTSLLLANELQFHQEDRTLWLFDSLQGLSKPQADEQSPEFFNYDQQKLLGALAKIGFPRKLIEIRTGFFEDITREIENSLGAVSFAFVDFDFFEPTMAALDFLHPRLSPGSYVVVDDYGRFGSGPMAATEAFIEKQGRTYRLITPEPHGRNFAILQKAPN